MGLKNASISFFLLIFSLILNSIQFFAFVQTAVFVVKLFFFFFTLSKLPWLSYRRGRRWNVTKCINREESEEREEKKAVHQAQAKGIYIKNKNTFIHSRQSRRVPFLFLLLVVRFLIVVFFLDSIVESRKPIRCYWELLLLLLL